MNDEEWRQGAAYGSAGAAYNRSTENTRTQADGFDAAYYGRQRAVNDHTAEYGTEDISGNKIFAITAYLMGLIGIIIALLGAKTSGYVMFHVRQSLKLSVCTMLLVILAVPFALMSFVPYIGILFRLVVGIIAIAEMGIILLRIIAFFQVCDGKAKELFIVGRFFT